MEGSRLTRRSFVQRGVAASIVVAAGINARPAAAASLGAGTTADGITTGILERVLDSHTALVSVNGRGMTRVMLAADAYVVHGVDGVVADLSRFIPGERVAIVAPMSSADLNATELQSVYSEDSGVVVVDKNGVRGVETATGLVPIAGDATERPGSSGPVEPGTATSATIWTDPRNGQRTAIMLCSS